MSITGQCALRVADLFSHFPEAVVVADLERRITYVNDAAVGLFGYTREELLGQTTSMLYMDPKDFQAQGSERFNTQAESGATPYRMRYKRADGQAFLANTLAGPIRDAEGDKVGFVGIVRVATVAERAVDVLQRVHEITSSASLDHGERIQALLELGAQHFELPLAIQSRVQGDTYTVESCVDPKRALAPGATFPLGSTYCVHTLAAQGPLGFHHAGQSEIREHPCFVGFGLESYLGCPVLVEGEVYGTLNFSRGEASRPFSSDDRALVQLLAHWVGDAITQHRLHAQLHELAITDPLTGMLNRRALGESLDSAIAEAHQGAGRLAVLSLDLDHFKGINDSFGHPVGDAVLCAVAEVLGRLAPPGSIVSRIGGEEFLVVLPAASVAEAHALGRALLADFRRIRVPSAPRLGAITASFGVAALRAYEDANSLLRRVDQAMYQAKEDGRACLRMSA